MRTIIVAFVVLLTIFSCDRDGPPPSDEGKIIGYWGGSSESTRNVDGSFNGTTRPCRTYHMEFREDNTLNFQVSEQVAPQQCTLKKDWRHEGRWERMANEKYRLFLTSADGRQDSIIKPERIWFPQENVMLIQFEPIIDNGVDKPFYYEQLFFKQN